MTDYSKNLFVCQAISTGALDNSGVSSHITEKSGSTGLSGWVAGEYLGCGGNSYVTLFCESCGQEHVVNVVCGDRACPFCREKNQKRLMARYRPLLAELDPSQLALVTVTTVVRVDKLSLSEKVRRLRKCWQGLIRRKAFRAVSGGMYTIEVKAAKNIEGAWNCHIHAICEAERVRPYYITVAGQKRKKADLYGKGIRLSFQSLAAEWKKATEKAGLGAAYIVDVSPVEIKKGGAPGALGYITKYMRKVPVLSPAQVEQYNDALKRVKLIHMFGAWYPRSKKYRFSKLPEKPMPLKCQRCGSEGFIIDFALYGLERKAVSAPSGRLVELRGSPGEVFEVCLKNEQLSLLTSLS